MDPGCFWYSLKDTDCPYEVVVVVFNEMIEMGMPKDIVISAVTAPWDLNFGIR